MRNFTPPPFGYPPNPSFPPPIPQYPMQNHFPLQNYPGQNDQRIFEDMKSFYHQEFEKNRTYIMDECQNIIVNKFSKFYLKLFKAKRTRIPSEKIQC